MTAMSEGVLRSLLMSDIARLQLADASERAASSSSAIDWSAAEGCEAFYGPTSVPSEGDAGWVEAEAVGMSHYALRLLGALRHRQRGTV